MKKHDTKRTTQQTQQTNSTKPSFDQAKREFELAYIRGDYAQEVQTLAQAVALSVLRKCIDPQRKTAGTLDTVSNSGLSGALLDLRRGIFHDTHALDRMAQAGEVYVATKYDPDGFIVDTIPDQDAKSMFDAVLGDTISDGMDLVHTAIVALLEEAEKQTGRVRFRSFDNNGGLMYAGYTAPTPDDVKDGYKDSGGFLEVTEGCQVLAWLDVPYTVRRPSRRVLIKSTDPITYREEETTPIQEVYRAVRRAIADSRAVQTDPRNGYTYLEVETEDGGDTVYLRTGKYADLGGYTRTGHPDSLPGAPAGLDGGYNPYTADRDTVDTYNDTLARLDLTRRQREIVELRVRGYGYQAIATRLGIAERDVRRVLSRLQAKCAKLGFAPAGYTDTPAD